MSVDHKRPMYAFVMVALICGLVIADQVRSEAQWRPGRPFSVVAGDELDRLPTSDPPVPGQPRRTTGEQTAGGAVETPAAAPEARQAHPAPSTAPTTSATSPAVPQGGLPEGGAPGSSQPPVEVVVPAPEPQAPAAGGQGQGQGQGQDGPGGVLEQLDLGETVQQGLQSAASSGHPGRSHALGHAGGRGRGVAGVRGAADGRGPHDGALADRAGDPAPESAGVDAGEGQDAPDAVTGAGAGDEAGAPVLGQVPVLPGWLEEAVSPRSEPAPPRP